MSGPAYNAPFDIAVPLVAGAGQIIATTRTMYRGIVVRDTGAGCTLRVWDNASTASGTIIDIIVLTAGQVWNVGSDICLACTNGVFVERVAGTTYEGSVRLS